MTNAGAMRAWRDASARRATAPPVCWLSPAACACEGVRMRAWGDAANQARRDGPAHGQLVPPPTRQRLLRPEAGYCLTALRNRAEDANEAANTTGSHSCV